MDKLAYKKITLEYLSWLAVNLIAPLLVPYVILCVFSVFFLFFDSIVIKIEQNFFYLLLNNGVYNFLGLYVIISLYYDFNIPKTIWFNICSALFVLVFSGLFISSLNIIDSENAKKFVDNLNVFYVVSVSAFLFSSFFKLNVLYKKYKV